MSKGELEEFNLNHVTFTVSRDMLDDEGRKRIVDFFTGLDFHESSQWEARDREYLAVVRSRLDQDPYERDAMYLVFLGHDKPATANPGHGGDHLGLICSSLDQYERYLERAKKYVEKDGGKPIDQQIREQPTRHGRQSRLHAFYVQPFTAPISVEVQYSEVVT